MVEIEKLNEKLGEALGLEMATQRQQKNQVPKDNWIRTA
jgi:hypothetical protein